MNTTAPTVTILLATFNRRVFLPVAIQCIADQTFRDWRLIVVNDGGENVSDIVASFADPRIEYHDRPHAGKAAALNYALSLVRSEWIGYMDDDDIVYPNHLADLLEEARKCGAQFVFSDTWVVFADCDGKELRRVIENEDDVTFNTIRFQNRINHKQILHTKKLADVVGPYDERLDIFIDYDYIRRLATRSRPVHLRKITGEHFLRRKSRQRGDFDSISGVLFSMPEKAGTSLLRIFGKDPEGAALFYRKATANKECLAIRARRIQKLLSQNSALRHESAALRAKLTKTQRNLKTLQKSAAVKIALKIARLGATVVMQFSTLKKTFARFIRPYRPRISVIVANYNYGNIIGETLDSLAAQTYRNFEVLVIDNGSTDDSVSVIRGFATRYPFIRLLQHEGGVNRGLPASLQLGIDKSAGEYVAFCESDDQWMPSHLETIVRFIDKHDRKPSFLVNDFEPFGEPDRMAEIEDLAKIRRPALAKERNRISPLDFRRRNWIFTFSCCMVRRTLLKSCDILSVPRQSNVDWWLWRQICLENDIYFVHEKLTRWRLHGASFTVRDRNPDSVADGSDMISRADRLLVKRNPLKAKALKPLLRPEDDYSVDEEGSLVGPDGRKTDIQPSFSIVIACGGATAGWLAKTLTSIDAQTYRRFEVILADAGEEANFPDTIPNGIAGKVSKSVLDAGTTLEAFATGVERAGGDWIVFLLPGDRMRPEHLKTFAARIVRESETKVFFALALGREPDRIFGAVHTDSGGITKVFAPLGAFVCRKDILSDLARKTSHTKEALPCATILAQISEHGKSSFFRHFVLVYNDVDDGRDPFGGELQKETVAFLSETCEYPIVSTVVLTYNHAPYIAQAIESALAQKGHFIHDILVVDNGSTDGTWDVVEGFVREHPGRIRAVRNETNIGISENFRKAFSLAVGKYVCVLEGDDYWCVASKVEKQLKFLESNSDCSMVFSRTSTLKNGKIGLLKYQSQLPGKLRGEDLASINEASVIANFSSTMFRRDLIVSLPDSLYEGRISEVALPFYLEHFGLIGYIPAAMSVYRIHPDGTFSGATYLERCRQKRLCRVQALSVCRPECRKALEDIIGKIDADIVAHGGADGEGAPAM